MLVVCTARPELLARRPNWGGGKLNASTVALEPLSDGDTARLMSTLLERAVLPAEVQQTLLDRAGGNPLYAEQFAQLYLERGSAEELPLPETLQGIIAARLDDLPADEKELLHAALRRRKGLLDRRDRRGVESTSGLSSTRSSRKASFAASDARRSPARSSSPSRTRSSATSRTGSSPRAERAAKHREVAEWLESLGRPETTRNGRLPLALGARARPRRGDDDGELAERARLALREAGDGRSGSTRSRPRRSTTRRRSRSGPPRTRSGRRCCSLSRTRSRLRSTSDGSLRSR